MSIVSQPWPFDQDYSMNSKWIKDLNIAPGTLKVIEGNKGGSFNVAGTVKDFLSKSPPVEQQIQLTIDK